MDQMITNIEGAEVYRTRSECRRRLVEIFREHELPTGLLPFHDGILEIGYNRAAGFLWLRQEAKKQHYFSEINRWICYDARVTAYVEKRKMRKIKGVTAKEFLITVTADEMSVDDPVRGTVIVTTPIGLTKSFHFHFLASAFHLDDDDDDDDQYA